MGKNILAGLISIVFLLIGGFLAMGYLSSEEFSGSRTETIQATPSAVWNVLTDIESLPEYRQEVTSIEFIEDTVGNRLIWKEHTDMGGFILFTLLDSVQNKRLQIEMDGSSFGMSGTWTYELEATADNSTQLTVIEDSKTTNAMVRSLLTLAGRDANLKTEFVNVRKALGLTKTN